VACSVCACACVSNHEFLKQDADQAFGNLLYSSSLSFSPPILIPPPKKKKKEGKEKKRKEKKKKHKIKKKNLMERGMKR
jgi:hypothetical protein